MSFTIVTVETDSGDKIELALPLDVPSRTLAAKVMSDLGRLVGTGETLHFFIKTDGEEKRIPATATLGELGIVDGQLLRIRREAKGLAPKASHAHAYLRTEAGALLGLEPSCVVLGRKDAQSQVPLDLDLAAYDPGSAVSRRHACIEREGGKYYLLDLHSTNGTRLNGEDIVPGKKVPLQDGDRVEFGHGLRVTFVTAKGTAPETR